MSNVEATYLSRPITGSESSESLENQDLMNVNFVPIPQQYSLTTYPLHALPVQSVPVPTQPPYYTSNLIPTEPFELGEEVVPSFKKSVAQQVSWMGPVKTTEFTTGGAYSGGSAFTTRLATESASCTSSAFNVTNNFAVSKAIVSSTTPLEIQEETMVTVNQETGVLANKGDLVNWSGPIPLDDYPINVDPNPEVIHKMSNQQLLYVQELAVRYLKPPTPSPPGDLIIKEEKSVMPPQAPPLVIRQKPVMPVDPDTLVIREAPPKFLGQVETKVIKIPGKRLPPMPRKLIIERLPVMPPKPQSTLVERWLQYKQLKRKVIFQKSSQSEKCFEKVKNLIIEWDTPKVSVKKEFRDLGVFSCNPREYVAQFGSCYSFDQLPDFAKELKAPAGHKFAAYTDTLRYELEGDLFALAFIDLDKEGLSEYKDYLTGLKSQIKSTEWGTSNTITCSHVKKSKGQITQAPIAGVSCQGTQSSQLTLMETFNTAVKDSCGRISFTEAKRILAKLNERFGRQYDERQAVRFIKYLDINNVGSLDFEQFKTAIYNSI